MLFQFVCFIHLFCNQVQMKGKTAKDLLNHSRSRKNANSYFSLLHAFNNPASLINFHANRFASLPMILLKSARRHAKFATCPPTSLILHSNYYPREISADFSVHSRIFEKFELQRAERVLKASPSLQSLYQKNSGDDGKTFFRNFLPFPCCARNFKVAIQSRDRSVNCLPSTRYRRAWRVVRR